MNEMPHIREIRRSIIDKVLSIKNKELLSAYDMIIASNEASKIIEKPLTSSQLKMLQMSDEEIERGDIISQADIDKMDSEWLS